MPALVKPSGPGGIGVLRSITGIPSFLDRLDELSCFFYSHISKSECDNPVRSILAPATFPLAQTTLLPRIHRIPLVRQWKVAEPRLYLEQEAREASRARLGLRPLPIVTPLVTTFIVKTRQRRLDNNGTLHLAARIQPRSRVHHGSFDSVLKIKNPTVRSVLVRWRRGIWGIQATCPACGEAFMPSHVARCQLLQAEWGAQCDVELHGDRMDLREQGACEEAISGYGFVDVKLARQEFGDAIKMLKDLCRMLDGVADWTGVCLRAGYG
jgi:hypothetical protein